MLVWFIKVLICCILWIGFIMAILGSLFYICEFLEKKWIDKFYCFPYSCLILMFIMAFCSFVYEIYSYLFIN